MLYSDPLRVHRPIGHGEPNHRQRLALERIDFAVGELATTLLSCCSSHDMTDAALREIRKAVAPIVREILADD